MSNTNSGLIDKITKLLALAEGNSNEFEAMAAAAKVQKLLAEHNLEMAEIQSARAANGAQVEGATPRKDEVASSSAMYQYQRTLMSTVARNNFCLHLISERVKEDKKARYGTRKVKAHRIIGAHVNVIGCTILYEYLIQAMDRLLPWQGMEKRGKNALLWLEGCVSRLGHRLDAQRQEAEAFSANRKTDAGGGNSLVLMSDIHGTETDLNRDHLYGWPAGTVARERRERDARHAAYLAELSARPPAPAPLVVPVPPREKSTRPETDRQRQQREAREKRAEEAEYARWAKYQNKYNSSAYRMGNEAGNDIGLTAQIDRTKMGEIG